ncbi:MAG TPA: peptide deformylase [Gammaproteobacteria bacterium]|jgi:peptide deformylase
MKIVKYPDGRLKQVCTPVTAEELQRGILDDYGQDLATMGQEMLKTCAATGGIGMAGPQVGIMRRVIVINLSGQQHVLVNPVITSRHGKLGGKEGCLSYPGRRVYIERSRMVRVVAHTDIYRDGFTVWEPMNFKFSKLMAAVAQHEIDHLDGLCQVAPKESA